MTRVLFAPNVRSPGGLILLDEILQSSLSFDYYMLPEEMETIYKSKLTKGMFFKAGLISRIKSELQIRKIRPSHVFSFNNYPPFALNSNAAQVIVYFHNVNIFYSPLKMAYLRLATRSGHRFFVQSQLILDKIIDKKLVKKDNIAVVPFYNKISDRYRRKQRNQACQKNILYVTNKYKKNGNRFLFDALANSGDDLRSSINVTVTMNTEDLSFYESYKYIGKLISPVGTKSSDEIFQLIRQHDAVINVSKDESFGMDLLEAYVEGLRIIAPDADFSQCFFIPDFTFAVNDEKSLIRCLRRYSGLSYNKECLDISHLEQRINECWKK